MGEMAQICSIELLEDSWESGARLWVILEDHLNFKPLPTEFLSFLSISSVIQWGDSVP